MTYVFIAVLGLWAGGMTWAMLWSTAADRKEREATRNMYLGLMGGLRAEVQALTEAIVRQGGGIYLSPITRHATDKAVGQPTEKWFEKRAEGSVVIKKAE